MKKTKILLFLLGFLTELNVLAIKLLHGPYLQNITSTTATFVWEGDVESIGWVELAPNDGSNYYSSARAQYYDCTNGVKNTKCLHAVMVKGLNPGVSYRYRVYSKEVLSHKGFKVHYGDVAAVDVYNYEPPIFTTLNPDKKETSFCVLNDVHQRSEIIEPLLKLADYKNRDLILFNGDMISMLSDKENFFKGFMDEAIRLFAKNKSPYYIRGNHETRGEFSTHFQDYFNPCIPHLYYTLREGPVYFIFLDTGEDKPDDDIEYSGIVAYDNYRTEQAEWLKTVKNDPEFQSARFRVVVEHIPTTSLNDEWHGPKDCTEKFAPILNTMDINVMLCGHTHCDSYYEPNKIINYPVLINSNNGIVFAETKGNKLIVSVKHLDGKLVNEKVFTSDR